MDRFTTISPEHSHEYQQRFQVGVPHRIGYLAKMLDELMARDDVVFLTGEQITDWFIAADSVGA